MTWCCLLANVPWFVVQMHVCIVHVAGLLLCMIRHKQSQSKVPQWETKINLITSTTQVDIIWRIYVTWFLGPDSLTVG